MDFFNDIFHNLALLEFYFLNIIYILLYIDFILSIFVQHSNILTRASHHWCLASNIVLVIVFDVTDPWWRHQMETLSALLAICAGNSPVPVNSSHAQKPVTQSFDVFFDLRLGKRLSKQSWVWWLRRHPAHYDVIVMHVQNHTFATPCFISMDPSIMKLEISLMNEKKQDWPSNESSGTSLSIFTYWYVSCLNETSFVDGHENNF